MRFHYAAFNLGHGVIKGQIEARDEMEARAEIEGRGLTILRVSSKRSVPGLEGMFPSLFRVKASALIQFSRQMATMLGSGGNLLRILQMQERESNNRIMRQTLGSIRKSLDEGGSLSSALAEHPNVFSRLFISVVEVGEFTGKLSPALDQMADILEKEYEAKQRAIRTLMYPIGIILLSAITLAVLMTVALPPLLKIFDQSGTDIPLMTRIVVGVVGTLANNFLMIGLVGMLLVVGFSVLRRLQQTRYWMDALQIRTPVMGSFIMAGELSRFSRTVAMLLEAGVSLASAVQLGQSGVKNLEMRRALVDAEESLLTGHGLTDALRKHSIFPRMFIELMMLGEESNSLQRTMKDAAEAYQKQLEQKLDNILGLLEPMSTLVVGGIVGIIAFSMFVPIYSGLNAVE